VAVISMKNAMVGSNGRNVVLAVPVDGRTRNLQIEPTDAIQIANQMATAAVKLTPAKAPASMEALSLALKPYGTDGLAHLAVETEHGPFVLALDNATLRGLASAAQAALELGKPSGTA